MARPTTHELHLLPGVPDAYVRARLRDAGGKEIESGKFTSDDSSAALAVNAFAWFHERTGALPPITEGAGWPARSVEVEYCARFPWSGGRHPWLDAFVETDTHIVGIESKRHEPFRDRKRAVLSQAYDRPVWGEAMGPFERMRDGLRSDPRAFAHLDATQLVKHAFGLVTESTRRAARRPVLVYLYAEPTRWTARAIEAHRDEVSRFALAVSGAAVAFAPVRWAEWIGTWTHRADVREHGANVMRRFDLGGERPPA